MTDIMPLSAAGDAANGLEPIGLSFPGWVVDGDPQEAAHVFYDRAIGQATVGIWTSESGTVRFPAYPFDELCIIVEGKVTLKGDAGRSLTFGPSDVFIVPKDWAGDWIMPVPLKKFYVELKQDKDNA